MNIGDDEQAGALFALPDVTPPRHLIVELRRSEWWEVGVALRWYVQDLAAREGLDDEQSAARWERAQMVEDARRRIHAAWYAAPRA